jgi:tetratricopeptide (TPR) repeat protein
MDFYSQNYKQKQYDDALPQWRLAYSLCPKNYRANLYVHGSFLLNRAINKLGSRNPQYREALIDSLLTLQDERLTYFPTGKKNGVVVDQKATILNNKGQYIINFRSKDSKYLYEQLGAIVNQLGSETKGSILVNYMQAAIALYRNGELKVDDVMNVYTRSADFLAAAVPADDDEATAIGEAKTTLESVFAESNVASCDNLVAIFGPRYEADPNNVALVTNIVKLMNKGECFSSDLYLKAVTKMHSLDPSASSAYFLYKLHSSRGNVNEAVKYIEEAIASCAPGETLAQYNYELAGFAYKNSMKAKAYAAAKAAADLDYGYAGKAYMIMGNLWAGTSCGGDEITRYAPRWAACDFYNKAKAADPSLADEANRQISRNSYYPSAADAFMYGYQNGQSYTVSCSGMTATTTIRLSR